MRISFVVYVGCAGLLTENACAFVEKNVLRLTTTRKRSSLAAVAPSPKETLRSLFEANPDNVLVDPTSLEPLVRKLSFIGKSEETWMCQRFGTTFQKRGGAYLDLTPPEPQKPFWDRSLQEIVQTDTFRNPLVAFLYERGWRQGFKNAGFPGIDSEFELMRSFFGARLQGIVLDLSCGSGLMSRKLAKLGGDCPKRLLSADFSEVMLLETARRFKEEGLAPPELVRADAGRLPIGSAALDALHAGAALHCWPQLDQALLEVARVLKPGGRFFATTFKKGAYGVPAQTNERGGPSFRFFDEAELEGLLKGAGFQEVSVELVGQGCLIARCTK